MAVSQDSVNTVVKLAWNRIRERCNEHQSSRRPFILGLTGLQGSGKSTWAKAISDTLQHQHDLKTVVISLDDFYCEHSTLVRIREENIGNPLLYTRGQPGTHDVGLATEFFSSLNSGSDLRIPGFDKSQFGGEGDRIPQHKLLQVSQIPPIDVVVFEGWCIGFQSMGVDDLTAKWERARGKAQRDASSKGYEFDTETLGNYTLQNLLDINSNLELYNNTFMGPLNFDFLVHLDTSDLANVYHWRMEQEYSLRTTNGQGMEDYEVIKFVRGYMPSYELYLDRLRREGFVLSEVCYIRLVLDSQRNVIKYETSPSEILDVISPCQA